MSGTAPTPLASTPARRNALRWGVRAGGLAVLLLGIWFVREVQRALPPAGPEVGSAATVLPVPKPLPAFSLADETGAPFGRERLEGRWSFLFFGYTNCPSICPITVGAMRDLRERLAESEPASSEVQFVFVSVDPARDDSETLRRYLDHFDPALVGARGEPEEIERLTREIGVFHERTPGGSEASYDFDHTASLLLVGPDARLHAVFSPPIVPEDAADAFRAIRRLEVSR